MDNEGFYSYDRRYERERPTGNRPRRKEPVKLTREEVRARARRFAKRSDGSMQAVNRKTNEKKEKPKQGIRSLGKRSRKLDKGTEELLRLFGNRGDAPRIRVRGDARFIIYVNQLRDIFSWQLIISLLLVLVGGLGTLAIHVHVANVENQIFHARSALQQAQIDIFTLESLLDERYTDFEIEWIATERLGMNFPDTSQIIEIYVPRQGGITLNTIMHEPPPENYLAVELRHFLAGILNRIFGGGI